MPQELIGTLKERSKCSMIEYFDQDLQNLLLVRTFLTLEDILASSYISHKRLIEKTDIYDCIVYDCGIFEICFFFWDELQTFIYLKEDFTKKQIETMSPFISLEFHVKRTISFLPEEDFIFRKTTIWFLLNDFPETAKFYEQRKIYGWLK
jgi:hypothetical protein